LSTLLHHYLYASRLAEGVHFSVVTPILEISRNRNSALHITGVLVFDGERFVQWMEGPANAVLTLARRIAEDTRHTGFTVLHSQPVGPGGRLADNWCAGYAEASDLDTLCDGQPLRGEAALEQFRMLIPRFDLAR
jgi:Sensors of blue-light using FAD